MTTQKIRAVLFDFGGVVLTSPFDAFARYERAEGFPVGLIRDINSTNSDDNAWARFERNDVDADGFVELFEAEARARGHRASGRKVLELIAGDVRPEMVEAIRRIKSTGLVTACLTNNFRKSPNRPATGASADAALDGADGGGPMSARDAQVAEVMALFDHVVESSVIGVRKPENAFYLRALEMVGTAATEAVFLDDLGINLKPARAMGMTTIKVLSAEQALADLEQVIGVPLRS
ncbi:MAG: HAD-IA family hydrolase [Acidimicrobiales bacterium]